MARVICTLPNASTSINGIAFTPDRGQMVSEEVDEATAARFATIEGYHVVPTQPANPAPAEPAAPAPTEAPVTGAEEPAAGEPATGNKRQAKPKAADKKKAGAEPPAAEGSTENADGTAAAS